MNTKKPFSTISYNSIDFLKSVCDNFLKENVICFYAFIKHLPEDDELKEHIHIYFEPFTSVDTVKFLARFKEIDINNPDKPLGCLFPQSSKFGDWFYYCAHDKDYLASKCQERKYNYETKEFVTSSEEYFYQKIHEIDKSTFKKMAMFKQAVADGRSFGDCVRAGYVPIAQINQYQKAFAYFQGYDKYDTGKTFRNCSSNHEKGKYIFGEDATNILTGEIMLEDSELPK